MNDEQQAQFFIESGAHLLELGPHGIPQWLALGRHLGSCECATDEARELVANIAEGMRAEMALGRAA